MEQTSLQRAAVALVVVIVLAGCANLPLHTPPDFPRLTVDPADENTLVFKAANMNVGRFRKVYVEPVHMLTRVAGESKEVTNAEALELASYARQQFARELGKQFKVVSSPAYDVLRLRFTITDLQPTSAAQVVMLVPPFAMINMLSPRSAFIGSITMAGELFEGNATVPSAAFVAHRSRPGVDATVAFGRWTAARKIIASIAEKLADDLVALGNNP